jgi:hypothetical protein
VSEVLVNRPSRRRWWVAGGLAAALVVVAGLTAAVHKVRLAAGRMRSQ